MKIYQASTKIYDKQVALNEVIYSGEPITSYQMKAHQRRVANASKFYEELDRLDDILNTLEQVHLDDSFENIEVLFVSKKKLDEWIEKADAYDSEQIGRWVSFTRIYTCLQDKVIWLLCMPSTSDVLKDEEA